MSMGPGGGLSVGPGGGLSIGSGGGGLAFLMIESSRGLTKGHGGHVLLVRSQISGSEIIARIGDSIRPDSSC